MIFLTETPSYATGVSAMRMGANDYLVKPCGRADVLEAVARAEAWRSTLERDRSARGLMQEALALARAVAALPGLRLRGIMTIPEPAASAQATLAVHRRAEDLFEQLRSAGLDLDTLSMGMSADLEAAIQAGSTLVRVGSAIFGARAA